MRFVKILIFLGICLLVITACQTAGDPTTAPVQTEESQDVPPPDPTDTPQATPTEVPPEPTEQAAAVEVVDAPVDECLDCHTDKERLIDTAKPEEEVISESSGEG